MHSRRFLHRRLVHIWTRSLSHGFVGKEGLHAPGDFTSIAQSSIRQTDKLISEISKISPGPEVIRALDEISDSVCSVADVANFCYAVHPDEKWRISAHRALQTLMQYIGGLNTNRDLFNSVQTSLNQCKTSSSSPYWSKEAIVVGESLYRDFVNSGIESTNRDRILKLINLEHNLGSQFQRHAAQHSEINALSLDNASLIPEHLHHRGVALHGQFHIPVTPGIFHTISQSVKEESVRKNAYLAHFSSLRENVKTLQNLLDARRKWANALGWNSFVSFKLQDSIAMDPASVELFLRTVAEKTRHRAEEEIKSLEKLKGSKIFPWDLSYYMKEAKNQRLKDLGLTQPIEFQISSVMDGLSRFLSDCMGIEMLLNEDDSFLWCSSVTKLTFWDSIRETSIGELYLDLFGRQSKVPENAHYTLRCGRLLHDGTYQAPIVALVTNFSSERINYYELKTLLHEFGHVLHSLLSRTEFQHLFGTRGPLDLVEIPSHFFEHFCYSAEGLQFLAGVDSETNEFIPLPSLQHTIDVNSMFQCLRLLDQVQIAMIDQKLHNSKFHERGLSTGKVVEEVTTEFGLVPHIPKTCKEAWLTHLVSYGGRYYSYIYSRYIGYLAWDTNINSEIFDRKRWTSVRNRLFKPGGAVNPQEYVWALIGKDKLFKTETNGWIPSMKRPLRSFLSSN